jgi:site-specific DNA recombinase
MCRRMISLALVVVAWLIPGGAKAQQQAVVRVALAGTAEPAVLGCIGPAFTAATGYPVELTRAPSIALANRIVSGELRPDVYISSDANVMKLLYYVSTSLVTGSGPTRSSPRRIPAGNLERIVIDRLRSFFANQGDVLDAIGDEVDEHVGHGQLIEGAKRIASKLDGDGSETIKTILKALVRRVELAPDCVKIDICRRNLVELLAAESIDLTAKDRRPTHPSDEVITLTVSVKLKRAGREMKMLVDDPADRASIDMSLLRIVARAHDIQARLAENTNLTVHDIARERQVTAAYVYTLLRIPWLAPDITTAIVSGRQPPQLNAKCPS